MSKLISSYRMKETTHEKITEIAKENNMSKAEVIELAIEKYVEEQSEQYGMINKIVEEALDKRFRTVDNEFRRLRVIGNVIDFHTQMHTEFWNHYFIVNKFNDLGDTETLKTDEVIKAEQILKNRIADKRQNKYNWEQKRKKQGDEE